MKGKAIVKVILSGLIIVVSLYLIQRLLMPKYVSDVIEGSLTAEYYQERKDHDVIFIGDCEVYENFSPQVLWDDFGINSYIRGNAQQLIWQSYYILEDTLRYETPKVVIFNVQSMQYNEPQKEAYNRLNIEGMEWSWSKLRAIDASMTEKENYMDYIFPILRYHSRWSELTTEDVDYMFKSPKVSHNGYYMRVDVKPAENVPEGKPLADYSFGENAYEYLDKINKLCEVNNIQLVLVKAPSLYPYWYEQWDEQIEKYAEENDLLYINFLDLIDETGLDFNTDTYDGGLHMNLSGAEKITEYLGEQLVENAGLKDRRDEKDLAAIWDEKRMMYEADAKEQGSSISGDVMQTAEGDFAGGEDGKTEQSTTDAEQDINDYKGYLFDYQGTVVGMNAEAAPILERLGREISYFEAASCAFNGLDKMYTYDGFELDTYPMDGKDYVSAVLLQNDIVVTSEGVGIGDSEEKVRQTYGDDVVKDKGIIVYRKDGMKLTFIIDNGKVSSIEYKTTLLDE